MPLNFEITRTEIGYNATMQSPQQSVSRYPVSSVSFNDGTLRIEIANLDFTFTGTVDAQKIDGSFKQFGQTYELILEREMSEEPVVREFGIAYDISGIWYGQVDLKIRIAKLNFYFKVSDGKLTALMQSPEESERWGPVSSVKYIGNQIEVEIPEINLSFDGIVKEDGIYGMLTQRGISVPAIFKREDFSSIRPQTPQPPFPYESKEITFSNTEQDFDLAGTLTLPAGDGPFTAVILVSGSGPQDRDETISGHKPFLVIADHLTRNGIAVLRYDDRGTAFSGGVYRGASLEDFLTDAESAINHLRSNSKIGKIGIAGHSEGGAIALMSAANHVPDFIITLLPDPVFTVKKGWRFSVQP
ncbi:MAG: alpha/beta hydrolase [Rikenellaceae bacterium]|nr:alpha/beta hydrolase [Rikenellaceae bacterium]